MEQRYHQALRFGSIALDRDDHEPSPYMISGRKMYVLGTTDAGFQPIGDEHLAGEMGGIWAQPVRFADGWFVHVHDAHGATRLDQCRDFEGHLSDVEFRWQHGPLAITRIDFVSEEDAALYGMLEVTNTGHERWHGSIGCVARIRLRPGWFSGWEAGTTRLHVEHGLIVAYDDFWQGRWGLAFGSSTDADQVVFGTEDEKPTGELRYHVELAPGETRRWEFLFTADHQNGHGGASHLWRLLTGRGNALLAGKRALYERIAQEGVTLETQDQAIVEEYQLAKVNLHMLSADYGPYLPGYLLAGVPEYPQLFGCDTAYSIAGLTAAGFDTIARSALSILGDFAGRAAGRVPHEITTNGRTFHPGNTQEVPQFTLAVWDYVRWTGDLSFLRVMYPICREGVMEYLPSLWDFDRDGYPLGDAMVERTGMGSLKLDSACYLHAAWLALAEMAAALGRSEAQSYRDRAAEWRTRFERDWWLPDQQLYADSLHSDLRPQLDGHWTQVVPVQLGIAPPERAYRVLDEIERSFVNEYGLMHTRGREDRVWTLPTGLLALAELRWGRVDQAATQLHNIARTTRYGMLGAYAELIPEGICFMQLWSAAMYVQCIVEGLLGLDPRAHEHQLRMEPRLPQSWPATTLRNIKVGEHVLTLRVEPGRTSIFHSAGPQPLVLKHVTDGTSIAVGAFQSVSHVAGLEHRGDQTIVSCSLDPRCMVDIAYNAPEHISIELASVPDAQEQ